MYYIGVDLGTSSVKILLMDEEGNIKNVVSRPVRSSFPHPGWSEQDPAEWYEETCAGLKELVTGIDPSEIGAIAFAGQMHGLVCLDGKDRVVRPAILWNDGRTGKETDYLNDDIGKASLVKYTSNIAFAGFTAPKILWLRENEPDNFEKTKKMMLPKDYLLYRFTGVHASDYSDAAGTLLLDVANKRWSEEMLRICDIDETMLPKLFESSQAVGTITEPASSDTGLAPGTMVVAGAADNAAAAIGTGTVGHGKCNISLGTSGTVFITGGSFSPDPEVPIHCFDHADGGLHLLGCMLSAASCNQWWCEDILGTGDYSFEEELTGLGESTLFFLPYLMGERTPWNDPDVRGCFIGLSRDTTKEQMTLAILEGVAFGIKDCMEASKKLGARITGSTICGGGAKSPLWRKILAAVLNIPLTSIEGEEGPGFGAAILAATGAGPFDSVEDAAGKLVKYGDTVHPDPELVKKYEDRYEKYRSLYPAVKDLF